MSSKKRKGRTCKQQNKINKHILEHISSTIKQSIKDNINPIMIKIKQNASFRRIQLEKCLNKISFESKCELTVSITIQKINYFYQNIVIPNHKQIAFLLIGNIYMVFLNGKKLHNSFTNSFRSILIPLSKQSKIFRHSDIACILQYFQQNVLKIYNDTSQPLLLSLKYLSLLDIYGYQPKFMFISLIQTYSKSLLSITNYVPYSVCELIFKYYFIDSQDITTSIEEWNKILPLRYGLKSGDDYSFKAENIGRKEIYSWNKYDVECEKYITFGIIESGKDVMKILNRVNTAFCGYRYETYKWQWQVVNYVQLFIDLKNSEHASLQGCINGRKICMKLRDKPISKTLKKIRFTIEPNKTYFPFIAFGSNYCGEPTAAIEYSLNNFASFYQNGAILKCYK